LSRDTIESLQMSKSLLEEEFVRTKDQLLGRAAILKIPFLVSVGIWFSGLQYTITIHAHLNRVADPLHCNADPDPAYHLNVDLDPAFFTLMRIRILLRIKVMTVCDHWSVDPPGLHFEPPL
jgi:hypothetical protein